MSLASFQADIQMDSKKTTKTSNYKFGKSSDIDGNAVTIENSMIHTYYQMNIPLLMNECFPLVTIVHLRR